MLIECHGGPLDGGLFVSATNYIAHESAVDGHSHVYKVKARSEKETVHRALYMGLMQTEQDGSKDEAWTQ